MEKQNKTMKIIILILLFGISFLSLRLIKNENIKPITVTITDTDTVTTTSIKTVYVPKIVYRSILTTSNRLDDSLYVRQEFNVLDSLYTLNIKTISKDSILKMDIENKYFEKLITKTDTFKINTTNTITNTIIDKSSTTYLGIDFVKSKTLLGIGPIVTLDFKRKFLINANIKYYNNLGIMIGGGIQVNIKEIMK